MNYDEGDTLIAARLVDAAHHEGIESDTYRHLLLVTLNEYEVGQVMTALIHMLISALELTDEDPTGLIDTLVAVTDHLFIYPEEEPDAIAALVRDHVVRSPSRIRRRRRGS